MKTEWKKPGGWRELTDECQARFRAINLHWHDLRHEYASRLVERGVPLAQVRDLIGHASITTTERYDNQKLENLQAAAGRLEGGKLFDGAEKARTKFQESFKNANPTAQSSEAEALDEASPNMLNGEDLQNWLGGRESFSHVQETPTKTGVFSLTRTNPTN